MTVTEVLATSAKGAHGGLSRKGIHGGPLPKLKLEMVLPDKLVNSCGHDFKRQPRQERLATVRYSFGGLKKPSGSAWESAARNALTK